MRFFSVLLTVGLAAFAAAQNATSTDASASPSTASASSTATIDATTRCLQTCGSNNICCQAACVGVPCPDESQVNATTECAAACPQGNGTQAETEEYASCQSACISSYFLTASTALPTTAPTQTGSATFGSDATATDSSSAEETGDSAASSSEGSAAASATGNSAAALNNVGKVGAGFLALVIAGLAL